MRRPTSGAPSLTRGIFAALVAVALMVALAVSLVSTLVYHETAVADAQSELGRECTVVSQSLGRDGLSGVDAAAWLSTVDLGDTRATLLDAQGDVLYDSSTDDPSALPNHMDRPEVAQAAREGSGTSVRRSSTVGNVSIYRAQRLEGGDILRLSVDRDGVTFLFARGAGVLAVAAIVLVAACWGVSLALSKRLVEPILRIDPARGAAGSRTYAELGPLVERLDAQQETLVRQMEELRSADAMRQQFTANVTHELKTPLTSIAGASELIRDGIAQPLDVPNFAARIHDEAEHMTELVNDILTLSRLDESERADDPRLMGAVEAVNLLSVSQAVADRLAPASAAARVKLTVEGSAQVVRGQPRLLDELVYNLCDNAIRYNAPGGHVRVEVGRMPFEPEGVGHPGSRETPGMGLLRAPDSAREHQVLDRVATTLATEGGRAGDGAASGVGAQADVPVQEGVGAQEAAGAGTWSAASSPDQGHGSKLPGACLMPGLGVPYVRVTDDGRGIPPESQHKVFERFYRVEKSRSRMDGGTGLGLAIVKHAAAFHGCGILLRSTLGEGTFVTVTFPRRDS